MKEGEDEINVIIPIAKRLRLLDHRAQQELFPGRCKEQGETAQNSTVKLDLETKENRNQNNSSKKRDKIHPCTYCEKKFATKYEKSRHIRTHTGEKPFVCEICSRGFADKGNLNKHESVHTQIKPHECSECPKTFSRRTHLRVHLRTHSSINGI